MPGTCAVSKDAMAEQYPANLTVDLEDDETDLEILNEIDENQSSGDVADGDNQIDLQIRNVVTAFHTCSHIDLRQVTAGMCHVVYDRTKGVVEKTLRSPHACVKIWSSGKIILAGCKSEQEALSASRRTARLLQKILGPRIRFASYRVVNIMATCRLPFGIKIDQVARQHPAQASYEPELNTGLIWRSNQPQSTVRVHTTGSIIVTGARSSNDIVQVLDTLYPILNEFRCQRPPLETTNAAADTKRSKNVGKMI